MAIILINDVFKKYLINQPAAVRAKIKKQFEFLEIGSWDGSLNVKKVKGTSSNNTIFEARLDKGNRILFTLGNEYFDSSIKNILIYVWGIVSHDEISSKSKSIIPKNAPFLNFTPYSQVELGEVFFDSLDNSYFTQESITNKTSDDNGSQKWHKIAEPDWQRIQLYTKQDFELFLYLTPDQLEVLKSIPPILLSGTAGSGKTTIAVYYLLKSSLNKLSRLFITYNKFLKNSAERLYNGLLNSDQSSDSNVRPVFYTYKEFCLYVAESAGKYFNQDKEIDFERFSKLIKSNMPVHFAGKNSTSYDIPLIWEEIRSIIKGALPQLNVRLFETALKKIKTNQLDTGIIYSLQRQLEVFANLESAGKIEHIVQRFMNMSIASLIKNLNSISELNLSRLQNVIENILELFAKQKELTKKKYLSFLEYETLGKKKAPNFLVDRKNIYQIFKWYQDKLESNGFWDELDLARETINVLSSNDNEKFLYDLVICDEVQDLTDVQHELLFYSVRNPLNLILTGDTKQIINPSGFRWEELRQHFYSRNIKVPSLRFLNLNFRSSGSIVELSNCLLEIKTNLLGLSSDQQLEDWKYKSRPPMVVTGIKEAEMINNLKITGAKKTILVRSDYEKEFLKKHLGTELIFTIYEAKGLEFDTILLWKFCADDAAKDLWKNILENEQITLHASKIKHEINLLYVAITRAEKDLLIYDGARASVIWQNEKISDKVFSSNDINYINNVWNVISTPEEWLEQGDYFFEREYYKAAIECYKNSGVNEQLSKAKAYYNEKLGNFLEAAEYFEEHGDIQRAAVNYEKCSSFSNALRLWTQLKNNAKIYENTLKVLELENRFGELAEIYFNNKEYQNAADYFVKSKDYENAAQLYAFKLKNYGQAAYYFEAAGNSGKAASLYAKLKNYEQAAKLYEKIRDFDNAAIYWGKTKNYGRLIQLFNSTNNYKELLKIYEKKKDINSSVKILRRNYSNEDLKAQAKKLYDSKKYYNAYLRYYAADDKRGIAECSFKLHNYKDAGNYYETAGEFYLAGKSYAKLKNYDKAFLCYIKSDEDEQQDYYHTELVSKHLSRKEISDYGQYFFEQENYKLALQCTGLNLDLVNSGICNFKLNNIDKAVEDWSLCFIYDRLELVADFCINESRVDLIAKLILNYDIKEFNFIAGMPYITPNSYVAKAMDKYFEGSSVNAERSVEMEKWAERLIYLDRYIKYIGKAISYFEQSHQFNAYFKFIKNIKTGNTFKPTFIAIVDYFKKNPLKLKGADENAAIGLFTFSNSRFLKKMSKLKINESNFMLFFSTPLKKEALEFLISNSDNDSVIDYLIENRYYSKAAEALEAKSNLKEAAVYYELAKDYKRSAALWIKLENYLKAGDLFFKSKEFLNALEMYEKHGKNKLKIADTLLLLGEYGRASVIYKQFGKEKLYKKALSLNKQNLPAPVQNSKIIIQPTLFDNFKE